MIYQETVTIPNNKAKAILELCKRMGIDLFDSYDRRDNATPTEPSMKKINDYLVEYNNWAKLTKEHLKNIFLTPRMSIEFDKKDVFGTTYHMNIQAHLESVLVRQIYFVELIINEIKEYTFVDKKPALEKSIFKKMITGQEKQFEA